MIRAAVITAAGSSARMKGGGKKEFSLLKGRTVLERAVLPFVLSEEFQVLAVTFPAGREEEMKKALKHINFPILYVQGGATRQESVRHALEVLDAHRPDLVLIHDGARPFVTEELIRRVSEETIRRGNATPVVPSVSAMKVLNPLGDIEYHLPREQTVGAQTPQGFSFPEILEAHGQARNDGRAYVDDSEIWSVYIGPAHTVPGETQNTKITYPGDLKKS